jgi:hypothetical protein
LTHWEYFELRHIYNRKENFWYWNDTNSPANVDNRLDEMGAIGWELVSTYTVVRSFQHTVYTSRIAYVFKRPID